jgi:hypothetical protein
MGKQKDEFKLKLADFVETSITFTFECSICGSEKREDFEGMADDIDNAFDSLSKILYKNGWRYSVSKTYGHVGLHCEECHKNRNKP